jgi:hypothetical protein
MTPRISFPDLKGDTLTYRVNAPTTDNSGLVSEIIWRRVD